MDLTIEQKPFPGGVLVEKEIAPNSRTLHRRFAPFVTPEGHDAPSTLKEGVMAEETEIAEPNEREEEAESEQETEREENDERAEDENA